MRQLIISMKGVKSIIQVLLNVAIVLALSYGLYHFIFNVWLDSYTNHNEFVEVPDLSKMKINEATAKLEELGLTYEVDSSRFDPNTNTVRIVPGRYELRYGSSSELESQKSMTITLE